MYLYFLCVCSDGWGSINRYISHYSFSSSFVCKYWISEWLLVHYFMTSTIFPFCKYRLFRDINVNPGTFPTGCAKTQTTNFRFTVDTTVMLRSYCDHVHVFVNSSLSAIWPQHVTYRNITIVLCLTSLSVSKMQLKQTNCNKTINGQASTANSPLQDGSAG